MKTERRGGTGGEERGRQKGGQEEDTRFHFGRLLSAALAEKGKMKFKVLD